MVAGAAAVPDDVGMQIQQLDEQPAFTTRDGSTIRELLNVQHEPIKNQSLAEATVAAGEETERHYHKDAEEIYFLLEGTAVMEVDGEAVEVGPGDAIAIPPGAWHQIRATGTGHLRFLCCCAPPYRHEDTYFA